MPEPDSLDADLALAIIRQMVREGALDRGTILRTADRATADRNEDLARAAHVLLLEAETVSTSEFEADYRRRQMRELTARLERDRDA